MERIEALEGKVADLEERVDELELNPTQDGLDGSLPHGNRYDKLLPIIEEAKKEALDREKLRLFKSEVEAKAVMDKLAGNNLLVMEDDAGNYLITDQHGKDVGVLCEDDKFRSYEN